MSVSLSASLAISVLLTIQRRGSRSGSGNLRDYSGYYATINCGKLFGRGYRGSAPTDNAFSHKAAQSVHLCSSSLALISRWNSSLLSAARFFICPLTLSASFLSISAWLTRLSKLLSASTRLYLAARAIVPRTQGPSRRRGAQNASIAVCACFQASQITQIYVNGRSEPYS